VPATHPLRKIREIVRDVLGELTRTLGEALRERGPPLDSPEQLVSALLLQVFYGIRSERQLMEQLDYNLLYPGSWDFRPTTRSGIRRPSRRTAIGCRPARCLPSS
jgi:transposase